MLPEEERRDEVELSFKNHCASRAQGNLEGLPLPSLLLSHPPSPPRSLSSSRMDPDDLFSFLAPSGSGSSSKPSKSTETKEDKRKRKQGKKERKAKAAATTTTAASSSSSKRPAQGDEDDETAPIAEDDDDDEEEASPAKRVRREEDEDEVDQLDQDDEPTTITTSALPVDTAPLPVVADEFEEEASREVAPSAGLEAPTTEGAGIKLTHQVSFDFLFPFSHST